jgi:hypothetical protein
MSKSPLRMLPTVAIAKPQRATMRSEARPNSQRRAAIPAAVPASPATKNSTTAYQPQWGETE